MKPAIALPPIEVHAKPGQLLGMPPAHFLRDYWQKRPLLIRGAFPGFVSPLSPEDLAGLACEEAALSRIVRHDRRKDQWTLRHGPFAETEFPKLPKRDWTLLVQDVDKWDADVRALLDRYRFLPAWRIDDVMISFAAPGGSVGAHVDQYDVFLLQGQGRRRWQIDTRADPPTAFRDDVELKLLRDFHPTHTWTLEAGDMLYLPPGVPHHGVAADACLTFSIGMRAPSQAELMLDFAEHLAERMGEEPTLFRSRSCRRRRIVTKSTQPRSRVRAARSMPCAWTTTPSQVGSAVSSAPIAARGSQPRRNCRPKPPCARRSLPAVDLHDIPSCALPGRVRAAAHCCSPAAWPIPWGWPQHAALPPRRRSTPRSSKRSMPMPRPR